MNPIHGLPSPGPRRNPTVRDGYTGDMRSESRLRAVHFPEHTCILRRTGPRVLPWPPCMLRALISMSLLDHLACSQHAAPMPNKPALHALGLRTDRSRRVQMLPANRIRLPLNLLRRIPGLGRREPSKVNGRTSAAFAGRCQDSTKRRCDTPQDRLRRATGRLRQTGQDPADPSGSSSSFSCSLSGFSSHMAIRFLARHQAG